MLYEICIFMNGILGICENLFEKLLEFYIGNCLQVIMQFVFNLLLIFDSILDWLKIEVGKMKVILYFMLFKKVISVCIEIYCQVVICKQICLDVKWFDLVFDMFKGDVVKISQILNNLLSNVVKFIVIGGVIVQLDYIDG